MRKDTMQDLKDLSMYIAKDVDLEAGDMLRAIIHRIETEEDRLRSAAMHYCCEMYRNSMPVKIGAAKCSEKCYHKYKSDARDYCDAVVSRVDGFGAW